MKKLLLSLATVSGLLATNAFAAEATFCTTAGEFGDKAVFTCGNGLKGTVAALYQQGWHVVALSSHRTTDWTTSTVLLEK
jgi:hypothetical protein